MIASRASMSTRSRTRGASYSVGSVSSPGASYGSIAVPFGLRPNSGRKPYFSAPPRQWLLWSRSPVRSLEEEDDSPSSDSVSRCGDHERRGFVTCRRLIHGLSLRSTRPRRRASCAGLQRTRRCGSRREGTRWDGPSRPARRCSSRSTRRRVAGRCGHTAISREASWCTAIDVTLMPVTCCRATRVHIPTHPSETGGSSGESPRCGARVEFVRLAGATGASANPSASHASWSLGSHG